MSTKASTFNKLFHYGQRANKNGWGFRRRICKYLLRIIYQCEIDLAADIDETVEFCHNGFGIVVNARSKIGGETCVQHCVTIGDIHTDGPVPKIGRGCFIGARAIILGDVNIGDNAKVGAGAVVLKNVPSNCTVVGIPARIIKENSECVTASRSDSEID